MVFQSFSAVKSGFRKKVLVCFLIDDMSPGGVSRSVRSLAGASRSVRSLTGASLCEVPRGGVILLLCVPVSEACDPLLSVLPFLFLRSLTGSFGQQRVSLWEPRPAANSAELSS
ncbi:hypothetical protein FKM82_029790 [Ascaphus truei]